MNLHARIAARLGIVCSLFLCVDFSLAAATAQAPWGDDVDQLRLRVQKLEALVTALTHESELLKKKLKECSDKTKSSSQ
jgi:hypothetical protein